MPPDLLKEIRRTARETGLSLAEAMRQSMALGAPKLRIALAAKKGGKDHSMLAGLKPLTKAQARRLYSQPNEEFDALEQHLASLPPGLPQEED